MKKILFLLAFVSTFAFAEASFDQVQGLIAQQNYSAAEAGLAQIIKNHPNSAKAYYSMAQAQAGLGNLDKARYALDKATGLDPTLSFASSSAVQSLREAITPQTKKIESVESHFWRNFFIALLVLGAGVGFWFWLRSRSVPDTDSPTGGSGPKPSGPDDDYHKASPSDQAYMRDHNMAPKPKVYAGVTAEKKKVRTTSTASEPTTTYVAPPVVQPAVVNNHYGSNNDGLVTGMILGNMMSNHHDHYVEREIVREVPAKSNSRSSDSSWDNSDSKSSSWDDSSSSSSSSSSYSSSGSDSSWSSSSDSSSSWDSGSSSSSSWD